ncbi:MAG: hypothetical protein OXG46_11420 [Chloroflexi bacterium]|nr:hypothetical protein [Chloroflexota bacterium]
MRQAPSIGALGLAFGISLGHPLDADLWIHLNTGRYLADYGRLPIPDPFTFGAEGASWIPHEWLSEWIIYQLVNAVGVGTTQVAFALLFAATWFTVARTLAACGARIWVQAATVVVGAVAAGAFSGIRPMQFGLFFLALTVCILIRHRRSGTRAVWLLPVAFLVWANVHGSFPIGFGAALAVVADSIWNRVGLPSFGGESRASLRALVSSLVLSAAAIALNPSGPALWAHPFWQLVTPARQFNSDWNPPEPFSQSWWGLAILIAAAITAAAWGRFRITPVMAAAVIVLLALSATARKTMAFSSVVVPALLEGPLAAIGQPRWQPPVSAGRTAAMLLFVVSIALGTWLSPRSLDGPYVTPMPNAARDYLEARSPARVWNTYHWGGFLTWTLWPESHVFIDGRYDPFADRALPDYVQIVGLGPEWRELLAEGALDAIVIRSDSALARALTSEPGWTVGYHDAVATVFLPSTR